MLSRIRKCLQNVWRLSLDPQVKTKFWGPECKYMSMGHRVQRPTQRHGVEQFTKRSDLILEI